MTDASNLLFQKSEQLIRLYIDSVQNAKDSLTLNSVIKSFDGKITNLNYDFPPDTDLGMSEQENDSLITLFKKLEAAKSRQDSIVMKKLVLDSISHNDADSLLKDATPPSHNLNN